MIIRRYISKEIVLSLLAVTGILAIIFLGNLFVRLLARAAAGKISATVLFKLVLIQVPYLISMLLPAGLFISLLLVYGRLSVDSEMTVLKACGVGKLRLLGMTQVLTLIVTAIVALMTLLINPQILLLKNRLLQQASTDLLVQTLMPGRFHVAKDGQQVYYVEGVQREKNQVNNVFMAKLEKHDKQFVSDDSTKEVWSVVIAETGQQEIDEKTGNEFIVVENGYRYTGASGGKTFRLIRFDRFGTRISEQPKELRSRHEEWSNQKLWHDSPVDKRALAELQWRIAIPLSIPILALLALPLSNLRPGRGRYSHLLPALLIYIIFANMLFVSRSWLVHGKISPYLGLWWLLALLLLLSLLLFSSENKWLAKLSRKLRRRCK